jgi:hypothetical protein
MFRLNTKEEAERVVVEVDGQISGEYIDVLEDWCERAASKGKPVRLFLRDVTLFDRAAHAMLRRIVKKGVDLQASGVYTSYLVEGIRSRVATGATGANGKCEAVEPQRPL